MVPVISVVLVTYNRMDKLPACLEAIRTQNLNKNLYEVLVIDDGSSDGTIEYLKQLNWSDEDPKLRCFFNQHKGASAGRNYGAQQAKGEIVSFTDDDCVPERDWLQKVYESFQEHKKISALGSVTHVMFTNPVFHPMNQENHSHTTVDKNLEFVDGRIGFVNLRPFSLCNLHIKRDVFLSLGKLDEALWPAEDIDLLCKFFDSGYVALHRKDIHVDHFERDDFRSMFRRWFIFGKNDTMMFRRHFHKKFVFETDLFHGIMEPKQIIFSFPISIYFQFNLFKLFLLLGMGAIVFPWIGIFPFLIVLAFFLKQKNPKKTASFLIYTLFTQFSYFVGALSGSIRNKIISI